MSPQTPDSIPIDEQFFDFKCPYCRGAASFPTGAAGQVTECPNCPETLIVPEVGQEWGRRLPIPILTSRLTLRRFEPADVGDLAEFMSDDELFPYADGRAMDELQIQQWLAADARARFASPDQDFHLAATHRDLKRVIGWVALRIDLNEHKQASLRLVIDRKHQRQGFGTEALAAVLGFCFAEIRLHRVVSGCDARNVAACRLLEKAGMQCEGQFREDRSAGGQWADTRWFGMLQREFSPASKPAAADPA